MKTYNEYLFERKQKFEINDYIKKKDGKIGRVINYEFIYYYARIILLYEVDFGDKHKHLHKSIELDSVSPEELDFYLDTKNFNL